LQAAGNCFPLIRESWRLHPPAVASQKTTQTESSSAVSTGRVPRLLPLNARFFRGSKSLIAQSACRLCFLRLPQIAGLAALGMK
jgi:hypothetical protein